MSDYRLNHIVPGQDPNAMYKWYEVKGDMWNFWRLREWGWVLDMEAMKKNKMYQRQCKAINEIFK